MAKSWTSTFDVKPVLETTQQGVREGMEQAAALVLADSQRRVPYEKGDLSRSGNSGLTTDRRFSAGNTQAAVTYTDRGAVDAHERTDVPAANGRERKFLESAMNSTRTEAAAVIAAGVRRKLGT